MSEVKTSEVQSGLEGVLAFATQIAEPDRDGGALRYRGVDIEELVGAVPYEHVWGLLVDERFEPGLGAAASQPLRVRSGNVRVDLQSGLAILGAEWNLGQLIDIGDEQARDDLARLSAAALSFVAQSARQPDAPAPSRSQTDEAKSIAESFLLSWRGEADPAAAKAIDAYWVSAAEHGMNASTFTARVVASTGADCAAALSAAVGALSGPLHGGAPSRVLKMLDEVEALGDAERWVKQALDRGERLMGFGHRVYRAEDPRARVLRRTSKELGAPRYKVALALEKAALAELRARRLDRVLETNVEFWAAIVLDFAGVPPHMFTSMFTCARTAGWAAHILEQKRTGRLVRPAARYIGPPMRSVRTVSGADEVLDQPVLAPGAPVSCDNEQHRDPGGAQAERRQVRQRAGQDPPGAAGRARELGSDLPRHVAPAGAGQVAGAPDPRRAGRAVRPARWLHGRTR